MLAQYRMVLSADKDGLHGMLAREGVKNKDPAGRLIENFKAGSRFLQLSFNFARFGISGAGSLILPLSQVPCDKTDD